MAVLLGGREAYLLRGGDGCFGEAIGQALDDAYAFHLAVSGEYRAQPHSAADFALALLFREDRYGHRRDDGLDCYFRRLERAGVVNGACVRPAYSAVTSAVSRPVTRPFA